MSHLKHDNIKDCIDNNTAYFGNDIVMGSNNIQKSARKCGKSCEQMKECQFWTYEKGNSFCYLKYKKGNVTEGLNRYVSGNRNCKPPVGLTAKRFHYDIDQYNRLLDNRKIGS